MTLDLATLAARICETDLIDGQPPSCSVISPAGAREITGPGSVTQQYLDQLPEPASLPQLNFNDASKNDGPAVQTGMGFTMEQGQ